VFLISILVCSLTLLAQEKRDTIHSVTRNSVVTAKEKRNAIMDSLDLTKDQEKKIKAINKEIRAGIKEIRDNTQLSKEDRKTKARGLILMHQKELSKILSPEQLARYKQLQKQRKDKADGLMMDEDN
jgi:Spy/CpxP family protein refolding chaperone